MQHLIRQTKNQLSLYEGLCLRNAIHLINIELSLYRVSQLTIEIVT